MNKVQRAKIQDIISELEAQASALDNLKEEEVEKYDNLPENLQGSSQAERFQETADALEQCVDDLNSLIDSLNDLL